MAEIAMDELRLRVQLFKLRRPFPDKRANTVAEFSRRALLKVCRTKTKLDEARNRIRPFQQRHRDLGACGDPSGCFERESSDGGDCLTYRITGFGQRVLIASVAKIADADAFDKAHQNEWWKGV